MLAGMAPTIVYTDGACSGNPGPGGWAWAVPGGAWARGHDPDTTNQRMELQAVLSATEMLEGELDVVTDSTYVANCFRDGWWKGWEKRGWKNSAKQPVANRDLWEPLIAAHKAGRFGVPRWVKGHSGDVMNDLVDRLAVASSHGQDDARGDTPPAPEELGPADAPGPRSGATAAAKPRLADLDPAERRAQRRRRDSRIPEGTLLVAGGMRELPDDPAALEGLRRRLAELFAGYAELHADLRVLTGLRPGAEALAGEAAVDAGVDWVAVLPWPDPEQKMSRAHRDRFTSLRAQAPAEVVLERKVPGDVADQRKALNRRDAWLAGAADLAVMVWDHDGADGREMTVRFERAIPDDVVILPPVV
jgi:ribonuclease HI